jgi:hypothetical protein
MKLVDVPNAAIDWNDREQVRVLIFSVRTDEPMKLGHAHEAVAKLRGYKTFSAWRADMQAQGLWPAEKKGTVMPSLADKTSASSGETNED